MILVKNILHIKSRLKTLIFGLLFSGFLFAQAIDEYKAKLVYSCEFDSEDDLDDWVMEGPGIAEIVDGKLLLCSQYYEAAKNYLEKNNLIFDGFDTGFYGAVQEEMQSGLGDEIECYFHDGDFRGGDIVFWNRFVTSENYVIEFDFQSLSKHALHMLMFSVSGMAGEDVFADNLKKRYGLAAHYTQSDLRSYRISFFAPGRETSNMRKSPGKIQTIKGTDYTLNNPGGVNRLKVVKYNNSIKWYINNQLSFSYSDELEDGVLGEGHTAIRLMVPAKGLYDNFKIYDIIK